MSASPAARVPGAAPPRPSRRRGLLGRLAATHLLVAGAALVVAALWLPRAVEQYEVASLERQLADEARLVRRLAAPLTREQRSSRLQALMRRLGTEVGARVTITGVDGRVLADSLHDPATMENHANRPEIRAALRVGLGQSMRSSRTLGMDRLYVAVPIWREEVPPVRSGPARPPSPSLIPHSGPLGVVRLSLSLSEVHRDVRRLRRTLFSGLALAALAAVILSLTVARWLAEPLRTLRDAALALAQGDLSRRAALRSRDEIGELAETFDRVVARLQGTIAELAHDRRQMRAVFDTMTDGLLVTDAAGKVRLLNPAAARLLGVAAESAAGKTVLEITLDAPLQTLLEEVLRSGIAAVRERSLRTPVEHVVAVSAVPIGAGQDSTPEGAVLVFHDLTTARQVERMRRDFVANASHELRTPLASMRVMVETLLSGARDDPEAAQHFLETLDRELRRMTTLVNDLLELSRLDARVEAAPTERVALTPLIAEMEEAWQAVARDRGLKLEVSVPAETTVRGEAQGVRQILSNLLDNALKYTPAGGQVRISAREEAGHVLVEVADTGIGIPAADRDRIFERFYRVDKDRSRDLGGTGLGLSIVKHLAQVYGGSVTAESQLNRGSTFRVAFRTAEAECAPEQRHS